MSFDPALYSSARGNWGTPAAVFEQLDAEFGFEIDAAALRNTAKVPNYLGPDHEDWTRRDCKPHLDDFGRPVVGGAIDETEDGVILTLVVHPTSDLAILDGETFEAGRKKAGEAIGAAVARLQEFMGEGAGDAE